MLAYSQYQLAEKPSKIIFLLHGYGSNKDDLISIAPELAKYLPDAVFISPNACSKFEIADDYFPSYQWFGLEDRSESSMLKGANKASIPLKKFIEERAASLSLSHQDIALVGFSQGAMMSLHIGLRSDLKVRCIVSYSGLLISSSTLQNEIKSRPEVMLIHGSEDQVVPVENLSIAKKALDHNNVISYTKTCTGLAHGIDADGIACGGMFLKQAFPNN